jgi:hypothetical protein
MRGAPSLRIGVRRSLWLPLATVLVGIAAVVAVGSCGLPLSLQAPLLIVALLLSVRSVQLNERQAGLQLQLTADGYWLVERRDAEGGSEQRYRLREASALGPLLTLRLVAADAPPVSVVLLPDSATGDELRRLRVWLRHGRPN